MTVSIAAAGLVSLMLMADDALSTVSAAFGNTIVSTYPDGRTAQLWLAADGSYAAKGRRGGPSGGRWVIKGQKLCLTQSRPIAVPFAFCTPIPPPSMAQGWSGKAATGEQIQMRIRPGRD